ncbi:hypothetical protein [Burkholderia gladioli]|uniref:hypothetical protein n=1 Tax=Burkholderia gladioli TaxID=28095 RepID=UPI001364D0DF|nr:hypothetical protein [Burkholderia gladioli]KAF1062769.1 hypothetical protein LvStA_01403 [Burkholderia gladioli]
MSELSNLTGALFSDFLSAVTSPIASMGGAIVSSVLSAVMEKRNATAREVLLDEIRHGNASPAPEDIEESVAIWYRYWRAAQEGAARLNLRLLAAVYAGQVRDKAIVADDFLYLADLLATLRRDEIILLGTFLRHSTPPEGGYSDDYKSQSFTMNELVPDIFSTHADFWATLGALQRTGLIASYAVGGAIGSGSSTVYRITNLLRKLNRLAEIEQIVIRNDAATNAQPTKK